MSKLYVILHRNQLKTLVRSPGGLEHDNFRHAMKEARELSRTLRTETFIFEMVGEVICAKSE